MWLDNGGVTNMYIDKSVGHTRANYNPSLTLEPDSGWEMGQFEKYNDMLFPVIGARSW